MNKTDSAAKPAIIVCEDDASVRNLITTTLRSHDYKFTVAREGREAISLVRSIKPDILLLDLGLPDIDGTEVIDKIREFSAMPIIVISARTEDEDKIDALDRGADDYLTKPFSVDELLARLRVTQRRLSLINSGGAPDSVFENGPLKIDFSAGCVFVDGNEIRLTPIEFKMLTVLSRNVGKVLTQQYLTNEIWGSSFESDIASLRVYMASLRKKLDANTLNAQLIQTHIGVGYRMLRV